MTQSSLISYLKPFKKIWLVSSHVPSDMASWTLLDIMNSGSNTLFVTVPLALGSPDCLTFFDPEVLCTSLIQGSEIIHFYSDLFSFSFATFLTMSILISLIIPLASFILSDKIPDREKNSVYECGFSPIYKPGKPFSIRFFIIAILFLVFDLEVVLLFPWSFSFLMMSSFLTNSSALIFFSILIIGLYYEWIKGGLEWE